MDELRKCCRLSNFHQLLYDNIIEMKVMLAWAPITLPHIWIFPASSKGRPIVDCASLSGSYLAMCKLLGLVPDKTFYRESLEASRWVSKLHGRPWGRLCINMLSYQYRDSHYKDKTVSSLLWKSHTWKDVFSIEMAPRFQSDRISPISYGQVIS